MKKKKIEDTLIDYVDATPYRNAAVPYKEVIVPKKEKVPMNKKTKASLLFFGIVPMLIPILYSCGMLNMYWSRISSPNAAGLVGIVLLFSVTYVVAAIGSGGHWYDTMWPS